MCLKAAENIEKETGKSIEVVDLRSLLPLDEEAIINSVTKTSRALVVHEDKVFAGFGGEVAALITEKAFKSLDAPVRRVGATFTPVGFNRILEKAILPDAVKIETAMRELLDF
jgi:2-oxoisovalerate dehydrogenase E1 component